MPDQINSAANAAAQRAILAAGVLATSATASEALRNLYEAFKERDAKFSIAAICRRAGIPSRGNLSDVMSGKRSLNQRYHAGIIKAFNLKGETARCMKLLFALDAKRDDDERQRLLTQLSIVKKALNIREQSLTTDATRLFFGLEVFCAFGLFGNRASSAQLKTFFAASSPVLIDQTLELLTSLDLIRRDDGAYCVKTSHVVFMQDIAEISHVEFLKLALAHAMQNVEHWFARKPESYFDSAVLSVKREQYVASLADLKSDMLLKQAELESGDADMLVRFNVQIYPIGTKEQTP